MSHLSLLDTKLTTILMIRHADVHNPNDIVYGRLPRFRLSGLGKEQAQTVANELTKWPIDVLYSSPQLRARQTARIIADTVGCRRIHTSKLIAEVLTGYEGQPNSILKAKFNFYDVLARETDESIAMIARRMVRFLDVMRHRHPGQLVAAVSHADPIMILRTAVLGNPLVIDSLRGKYYPSKCSITQFSYPDGAVRPAVIYRPVVRDESPAKTDEKTESEGASAAEVSKSGSTPWLPKEK